LRASSLSPHIKAIDKKKKKPTTMNNVYQKAKLINSLHGRRLAGGLSLGDLLTSNFALFLGLLVGNLPGNQVLAVLIKMQLGDLNFGRVDANVVGLA
jgi:hypothetical protein